MGSSGLECNLADTSVKVSCYHGLHILEFDFLIAAFIWVIDEG